MGVTDGVQIRRDYWGSASTECNQTSQRRSAFLCWDWSESKKADDIEKFSGVPVAKSPQHILRPQTGDRFDLLHDEARLRGHSRWRPLWQSRRVLRYKVAWVARCNVGEWLAHSGRNWWVW